MLDHASVLAALYLRGPFAPLAPKRSWRAVLSALRRGAASLPDAAGCLRSNGLREEALLLQSPGRLAWAARQVARDRILTPACAAYPASWLRALGAQAPPALWRRGAMPPGPFLTVVGNRQVRRPVLGFSETVAARAVDLGFSVASGGAQGCDSAAVLGAVSASRNLRGCLVGTEEPRFTSRSPMPVVEIWPCGLGTRGTRRPGCTLSLCEPLEPFSSAAAMERNALLYALADLAVVCHARFKEGGTWHGAMEAMRRSLCRMAVRWDATDRAARAFVGLGAFPMESPNDLEQALDHVGSQPHLALSSGAPRGADSSLNSASAIRT